MAYEENVEAGQPAAPATDQDRKVDPARAALVKQEIKEIKAARKHHMKAFDRMRVCMDVARHGAGKEWVGDDPDKNKNFTVPLINRHVNMSVANLYAKNPKAYASRRKKLMYTVWDGDPQSLMAAGEQVMMGMQQGMMAAQQASMAPPPVDERGNPLPGPAVDPNAMAIVEEVMAAKEYNIQVERMARTMELLFDYYFGEQDANYKSKMKGLVRRTKVCGVGWVKLGYQRLLEKRPEITAQIADITGKIKHVERLQAEVAEGDLDPDSPKIEDLKLNLADMESQEFVVVREGPVLDFPRAREVIPDKRCRNVKTLEGATKAWHEFDMTPEDIKEIYGVDVKQEYEAYSKGEDEPVAKGSEASDPDKDRGGYCRVWEGWNKKTQQTYVVIDGYCDFVREPKTPDVLIERFWPFFPYVLNECEHEDEIYPLSDVWLAKDLQDEINRSKEGLREHRKQSRPGWVAPKGKFDEEDKGRLKNYEAGELLELNAMAIGEKIDDIFTAKKNAPIDPNVYETEQHVQDMTRVLGTQEANMGTQGKDETATGQSIAEQSRQTTNAENVDELDDLLSDIARAMGQLMLMNTSKETAIRIAGPGAVWPDMPETRAEVCEDLLLEVKAGSSGRPNKAAELANLERAMPFLLQMQGTNMEPFAKKYCQLLDIDLEEGIAEGAPSMTAINAMMSKMGQGQPGTGDPASDPNQQGGEGNDKTKNPQDNEPGGQPAMPAPGPAAAGTLA